MNIEAPPPQFLERGALSLVLAGLGVLAGVCGFSVLGFTVCGRVGSVWRLRLVSTFAAAASSKPNIVIILADDLGLGDVGCFNAESKIRTPHIDKLASEGMKFTDAHSPGPLCHPSRYGLITGRFPFRTQRSSHRTKPVVRDAWLPATKQFISVLKTPAPQSSVMIDAP